ncbi:MAG: PolC-type DNA polymerase III [Clostridia bacterium]|nr:PolC-type DNA polymerase III [Clostridia bacterium]
MSGILELFDKVTVLEGFAVKLEQTTLVRCDLFMEENRIELELSSPIYLPAQELLEYRDSVKNTYGVRVVDIRVTYPDYEPDVTYFEELLYRFLEENGGCRAVLSDAELSYENEILTVSNINGGEELLKNRRFIEFLTETARRELCMALTVDCQYRTVDMDAYLKEREEEQHTLAEHVAKETAKPAEAKAPEAVTSGTLIGKAIQPEDVMPIFDLSEGMKDCVIEGEVLSAESRVFTGKSNRGGGEYSTTSLEFNLGDDSWGCFCKLRGNTERMGKALSAIKEGSRVRLRGDYDNDEYAHKVLFTVKSAELLDPVPVRQDTAEEKRVELHLHTKMSALDAVSSATDLINRAAMWGHKAIAITDHGVAQAYPEAVKAVSGVRKKTNPDFKILYGMEGYLINDTDSAVRRLAAAGKSGTYVVFDIETTGLSPAQEEITEIGAVKIADGVITETFSQLINPQKSIPDKIVQLTGITDAMVADKPTIDAVLPEFLEFCADAVVVAHNAAFDTGFIRQKAARLNLTFANKVMDTLYLSRELFPKEEKHSLGVVAERLGVSLENHHRAVDDATATAEIFMKFQDMAMEQWGKDTKPQTIDNNPALLKSPRYHIVILAKNPVGLKNLYQLISKSNLQYYYRKPQIPKSVLEQFREGLILGSACEAGELFRAIVDGKSQGEIEDIASFYDFLEIQPIGNNRFMVRNGSVKDDAGLQDLNRKVVALGDKLGIPVCATCDVHFMDPKDEMYRRVLQGAQGYEDADQQAPLYLRTTDEMLEEFSYLGEEKAYEVVVKNTNRIADMIEDIAPLKTGSYPPSIENCEQDLVDMCHKKAHAIYGDVLPKIVQERMDKELDCIVNYGFSVMYMIAHKLVKKSNEAGYLVGSRGSVGSSFAAFLSDITEVNALCPHYICPNPDCKYSEFYENGEYQVGMDMPDKECPHCGTKLKKDGLTIPFETFLGFKGDKVPDIDLNFSGEYQATAHKYVGELFGEEYVFKAGTIGTIADKTAIGFYGKKYYESKGIEAPEAELLRVSKGLIDVKRTTGQHPGGIIVCPKTMDIHDFCPVQHPADKANSDIITTHFDFHSIHDNLLKLDILGHDDPSTIRMLEDLTGVNAKEIPLDDKTTMSIFSGTEALGVTPEQIHSEVGTFGVPEFGTSFTRQMLVDTKPTTFVELVIIAGLSHGTDVWLNNAQDLVKSGKANLSQVIGLRDDIMVFLMQNGVEPSLAFKIMEYVRKGRAAREGMPPEYEEAIKAQPTIPDWYLESCKKIQYMFPKAHAAAYVMMAFRIAWFKVNFPTEFYIAYYTVRADLFDATIMAQGKDKVEAELKKLNMKGNSMTANEKSLHTILEICLEMYERGIEFLPVDLYQSHASKFQKVGNAILPPLNAFPGVGTAAAESIYKAAQEGKFLSQEDLKNRSGANKSVIETLKENGVLKDLAESSQMDMFGLFS